MALKPCGADGQCGHEETCLYTVCEGHPENLLGGGHQMHRIVFLGDEPPAREAWWRAASVIAVLFAIACFAAAVFGVQPVYPF